MQTLTGGRLKRIREYIGNDTFLMTYGDGVSDVDILKIVEFHKNHGKLATLTAVMPEGSLEMKIVMLGGTGYLGQKVLNKLAEEGHEILCVTRTPFRYTNSEMVQYCDLVCMEQEIHIFQPEVLLSAIGRYLKGEVTEHEVLEANFEIPAQALYICIMSGVKRVITIGTSLPDDLNMYTFSKKLFVDLGQWYALQDRIEFINVKLEMFYGIGEPEGRFLPWMIGKMLKDEDIPLTNGTQKRDIIYVDDVVEALKALLEVDMQKRIANVPLGSGEAPSIRDVAEYLHKLTGSRSELLFGKVPMRTNEPDTLASRSEMDKWGIVIKYDWKTGMGLLVKHALENKM